MRGSSGKTGKAASSDILTPRIIIRPPSRDSLAAIVASEAPRPTTTNDTRADAQSANNARLFKLACLIAGTAAPPRWLAAGVIRAVDAVSFAVAQEKQHYTPAKHRKRSNALRKAAGVVVDCLRDPPLMRAINALGGDGQGHDSVVLRGLLFLIERANKTVADIPTGRGRHRHDPGTRPREVCAMLVAVAWREARGKAAPGTGTSNDACTALWKLAGKAPPSGENVGHAWRGYVLAANKEAERGRTSMAEARALAVGVSVEAAIEAAAQAAEGAPLWSTARAIFGLPTGLLGVE